MVQIPIESPQPRVAKGCRLDVYTGLHRMAPQQQHRAILVYVRREVFVYGSAGFEDTRLLLPLTLGEFESSLDTSLFSEAWRLASGLLAQPQAKTKCGGRRYEARIVISDNERVCSQNADIVRGRLFIPHVGRPVSTDSHAQDYESYPACAGSCAGKPRYVLISQRLTACNRQLLMSTDCARTTLYAIFFLNWRYSTRGDDTSGHASLASIAPPTK